MQEEVENRTLTLVYSPGTIFFSEKIPAYTNRH